MPKSKFSFNPADGPPPHPEKVIIPFSRPTNSPRTRTSTAKTTSYLPVKASKHAPYHTAQTLAGPKICNSKTFPQRSKEQLALYLPRNAQHSRSQDGDFFTSLSFDVRHMMYIQVPRRCSDPSQRSLERTRLVHNGYKRQLNDRHHWPPSSWAYQQGYVSLTEASSSNNLPN